MNFLLVFAVGVLAVGKFFRLLLIQGLEWKHSVKNRTVIKPVKLSVLVFTGRTAVSSV